MWDAYTPEPIAAQKPGDLIPLLVTGAKHTIIATGSMVKTALDIAHALGGLNVWSAPTLKPINEAQVAHICATAELVFTIEEHSILGGLGSIVAEIAAGQPGAKIERIGVRDKFSQFCGSYNYLLQEHGLDQQSIRDKILAVVRD